MNDKSNICLSIVLFMLCGIGIYGVWQTHIPINDEFVGPLALPWFSIAGCLLCASIMLLQALFTKKTQSVNHDTKATLKTIYFFIFFISYLGSMVFLGKYFLENQEIELSFGGGFSIASFLFLTISMYIFGCRPWYKIVCYTLSVIACCLLIFGYFFNILLP